LEKPRKTGKIAENAKHKFSYHVVGKKIDEIYEVVLQKTGDQ